MPEPFETFLAQMSIKNPNGSLEDALKAYIAKHNLAVRLHIDEAPAVVDVRTKLQILEASSLSDPSLHPDKSLQNYIAGLRFFMSMYRPPPQPKNAGEWLTKRR